MMRRRVVFASLALLIPAALISNACCAHRLGSLQPRPSDPAPSGIRADGQVEMTYLGCGGWILRRGDVSILTAPFFSNPGFLRAGLGRIESKPQVIDDNLPPVSDAAAILVGHAHYDHLMDVPHIAIEHARDAVIYGSATTAHTLAAVPELDGRVVAVNDTMARGNEPGEWITVADGRIRLMAVASEHAPHYMGIKLYQGAFEEDLSELPRRAGGWKEGQTLSFLIDFLDPDGSVAYRIHYQDSASSSPIGFPPRLPDEAPFDAAILCGASFTQVDDYPDGIVKRVSPRVVLVGHWEDFFIPYGSDLRQVRATNIDKFVRRLEGVLPPGAEQILAKPGATYRFSQ